MTDQSDKSLPRSHGRHEVQELIAGLERTKAEARGLKSFSKAS